MWRAFCKAAGHESWANDERFRTNAERVQNRRALSSLLEPIMLEKTTQEWIDLLRAAGIPCGKIQSVGEICEDPQIIARDMVVTVEHPKAGATRVTGVPVKLSDTPGAVTLPPPLLGEHSGQALTEWLQMSTAEVERLRQAGAL
jgi:crotonobetainyl-CoA:carnitine CoA-transferase CaiB-like acyl-CoA transferase